MISFYCMQVLEEVSRKSEWNSWMTQAEALFEMSKDQVQNKRDSYRYKLMADNPSLVHSQS